MPHVDGAPPRPLDPAETYAPARPQPRLIGHVIARLAARGYLIDQVGGDLLERRLAASWWHAVSLDKREIGAEDCLAHIARPRDVEASLGNIGASEFAIVHIV